MASRLASGGINLAASTSSYNVSGAAGPDVNYHCPTERRERKRETGREEETKTKQKHSELSSDCLPFPFQCL